MPSDTRVGAALRGLRSLFNLVGEMLETGQTEVRRSGEARNLGGAEGVHMKYGYLVKILMKDEPTRQSATDLCQPANREPLLDVFEEKNSVKVLTELPGVELDEVRLTATRTTLTISVEAPDLRYRREVPLPAPVKSDAATSRYHNGVLEVELEKADA